MGPLDQADLVPGICAESLVWQELSAVNALKDLKYSISFWRTTAGLEVDFILYGPSKMVAIEVKSGKKLRQKDLVGLLEFRKDYPGTECFVFYGGEREEEHDGVKILSLTWALANLDQILGEKGS